MTGEELLISRFKELALKAYDNNYYTCTGFLSVAEISLLKKLFETDSELKGLKYTLFGGSSDCERCMAAFGDKDRFGYEFEFPVKCIHITPKMQKFADKLSHRDILGAVLNLGTTRGNIGDIYMKDNTAYVFCSDVMAAFITDNLEKVKHTPVRAELTNETVSITVTKQSQTLQLASLRMDNLIAKVYKLSRNEAAGLIKAKKLFVNGVLCESSGKCAKEGELITLRGYGRFEYDQTVKETKKGNLVVTVKIWK